MSNIFNTNVTISKNGFIDKDEILKYVSEEDIFELVFGRKPNTKNYYTSPFRVDEKPGCWFIKSISGKLKFVDFASEFYINGKKMIVIDCFDAVQQFFGLPNLYQTLLYIKQNLIEKNNLEKRKYTPVIIEKNKKEKSKVTILYDIRDYFLVDKEYWYNKYQITKENLIEDKVYPISKVKLINSKFGDFIKNLKTLAYCYTDFDSGNVKIYKPKDKDKRFLTNCNQNDIGGLSLLNKNSKNLIITKSYKDYRVLKNQGLNVIWFQNEGMFPSLNILLPLCKKFHFVFVFFDNDKVGIEAAEKLVKIINSYIPGKASNLYIPVMKNNVKDPSDFIEIYGRDELLKFLIQNRLT